MINEGEKENYVKESESPIIPYITVRTSHLGLDQGRSFLPGGSLIGCAVTGDQWPAKDQGVRFGYVRWATTYYQERYSTVTEPGLTEAQVRRPGIKALGTPTPDHT